MDRALNPTDLADALGVHAGGPLPSVQELIDLIADVEVQAFVGPDEIDNQLLRTAWYLHGVASASNAEELFTRARQQRAFRVSAHIFDLALNVRGRSTYDRLMLAFAAQVGYRRSDLDPNSTAIWRRVDPELNPDLDTADLGASTDDATARETAQAETATPFSLMALRAGVAFLGLDFARTTELLRGWQTTIEQMRTRIQSETLFTTMFGPAEQVVSAVDDLIVFLRYGLTSRLDSARGALVSIVDRSAGHGDHDARWVAAHLLPVIDDLESSSVWTVLPSGSPDALAQAFTIGTPPVLTLWPPQRDLLMRQHLNPLDPETKRLLLSVPTSTGKTLIAQILICHHLATAAGDVCYVTPLRSLGREMRQALASRLRILNRGLGDDLPDFGTLSLDDLLNLLDTPADATVEVMTPERLAHMLRRDPAAVLDRFSMFVIDETHLVAQADRGFLLESVLGTLATSDARLILLSGVMGNAQGVAAWLDDSDDGVLFSSAWRGPRRLHGLLYSTIRWETEVESRTRSKTHPIRKTYDVVGELRIKPAEANTRHLRTSPEQPLGKKQFEYRADGTDRRPPTGTPFYKVCAAAARALLPAGSLLMIVSQRGYARDAALTLAQMLPESNATGDLVEFLIERIGDEHPLVGCVRHGVAYHHAGLPVDVLDAIEQAMRAEHLRALVATTTLTDGVNLPVRTVLISETRFPGQDPSQQLNPARLLNAVGRAGRAGRETEGWIVLALQKAPDDADFGDLRPAEEDLEVRSTLDSAAALDDLVQAEALINETADAIFLLSESAAAQFASFVWFVISAHERLEAVQGSSDMVSAVQRLLAFKQLPPDLAQRWRSFAERVGEAYFRTPSRSRHRWAVTGTSLGSARAIENIAARVAAHVREAHPPGPIEGDDQPDTMPAVQTLGLEESLAILHDAGALAGVMSLPEGQKAWQFRPSPGSRIELDVPLLPAISAWLHGLDMPSLAASILPEVPLASWRLEQIVDAVSGTFEHYLAWTIGAVIEQANDMLIGDSSLVVCSDLLASAIRYGVDTEIALALLMKGVRSRRIAYRVGRRATDLGFDYETTITWLTDLHIDGWVREFDATGREIEDLSEVARDTRTSLLRQLLSRSDGVASLRHATEPPLGAGAPVQLRVGAAHDPVDVWTVGDTPYRVGVVSAQHHADILLLHHAGLTFSATTDGRFITLRADNG